MGKLCAEDSI